LVIRQAQPESAKADIKPKFVVACIPAFNEERTIARVVIGAHQYVNEVMVCDDGSTDMTATIAEKLGAKVIRHEQNMGKGEALRSLFIAAKQSGADFLITLDGDGQHDPGDIPRILGPLLDNSADVVVGARFQDGVRVPQHRLAGNKILNALSPGNISDTQSGFRGYNRNVFGSIIPSEMGMGVDSELLIEASGKGYRITEVPVSVKYGIGKTSTHNPIYHGLDVLLSIVKLISIRHPLMFYGIPGLALVTAGIYFAYHSLVLFTREQVINNLVMTYELVGFALTLFGLLTLFTGIILFTLTTVVRKSGTR
jgi:glycosyltransferase involved in cell wall biosynthesis